MCRRQHQLDPVELVDFACARVIVDGDDIRQRVAVSQLFDYAFAYDMVRQAAKRLGAYDIVCACMDQLEHLRG